jgi:hypothetical protein
MMMALLTGKTAVIQPDIPHIAEPVIVKYVIDLAQLGLL